MVHEQFYSGEVTSTWLLLLLALHRRKQDTCKTLDKSGEINFWKGL